jgi:hypothetical protein
MLSAKREAKMMLDEAILEELKLNGAGTVRDIGDRLSHSVYAALKRLIAAGKVREFGIPGKGYPKTYALLKPAPITDRFRTAPQR